MKILKYIFIFSLIVVPFYYLAFILSLLDTADLSMVEVHRRPDSAQNHSVHLVTYAHGPEVFHKNRHIAAYSAINRGIDFMYLYRKENLDPQFLQDNPILNEKPGAGYWLWKPYLILKTLEQMPEGDVLLYADSGLLISRPISEFIADMLKTKDIVLFDYDSLEYGTASSVANGDTFAAVDCQTEACFKSPHVWAGLVLLRNSPKSRAFIQQWLSLCQNTALLTGQPSKTPNQPNFSQQQHDEGILCALAAKHSHDIYFQKMNQDFFQHFVKHRRKLDRKSLLGFTFAHLPKYHRMVINEWFVRHYARVTAFFLSLKKDKYTYKPANSN
jgi:hypothetical protein